MGLSLADGSALALFAARTGRSDLRLLSIIESEVMVGDMFDFEGISIIPLSALFASTIGIENTDFGINLGVPVVGGLWAAFKGIKWSGAFLLDTPTKALLGSNLVLHYTIDVSVSEIRRTRAGANKVLTSKRKEIGLLLPSVSRGMAVRISRAEQIACVGMVERAGIFVVDGSDDGVLTIPFAIKPNSAGR